MIYLRDAQATAPHVISAVLYQYRGTRGVPHPARRIRAALRRRSTTDTDNVTDTYTAAWHTRRGCHYSTINISGTVNMQLHSLDWEGSLRAERGCTALVPYTLHSFGLVAGVRNSHVHAHTTMHQRACPRTLIQYDSQGTRPPPYLHLGIPTRILYFHAPLARAHAPARSAVAVHSRLRVQGV